MATSTLSHNLPHFSGKSYEITLNQSMEALLSSPRDSNSRNSTDSASEFQKLMQFKADPPLESIWVYAALTFTSSISLETEPFRRISDIKYLFQLMVSASASCNSVKTIALVAPVVYNLHKFILDLKGFQLEPKKERKISREIKSLVDSIFGYINVCCNGFDQNFDQLENLIRPIGDLIRFWLVDDEVENMNVESLRVFFPLLSDNIAKRVVNEGCEMVAVAGFVVAEAFLLKLCWKIREEGFGEKMQNELRYWIVGSTTGLQSSYFYVTVLSMLLEPVLPINSLVNLEHEDGLREVLFDALVLVEYSFLSPESLSKLPVNHAKRIIVAKLVASHEAIELLRQHGDQSKAISYLNAFANSSLPGLIIKWVRDELGNESSPSEPTGASPRAFLRWMLNIEKRGIKIFEDDMSKFRSAINSEEASEQLAKPDSDLLFYVDNKGQDEYGSEEDERMSERMSAAFTDAAHSIQSSEQRRRKRKTKDGEKRKMAKFVKYSVIDDASLSEERSAVPRNDHKDSGSDLKNQSSDEDTEIRG